MTYALIMGAIAFIIGLEARHSAKDSSPKYSIHSTPLKLTDRDRLMAICAEYSRHGSESDAWWLKNVVPPGEHLASTLQNPLTNIQIVLRDNRNVSPFANEICSTMTKFHASEFEAGHTISSSQNGINLGNLKNILEICFVPKSEYDDRTFPSSLFYRSDWQAIVMCGIKWPRPLFDSLLMHEMGHAFADRYGSSNKDPRSTDWILEEVRMHQLGFDVIDHWTKGQYSGVARDICKRYPECVKTEELLGKVKVTELLELDRVMGIEGYPNDIRKVACADHIMVIGFAHIDCSNRSIEEKARFYKWVLWK